MNERNRYTVGWLSALPKEQATVVMDKEHDKLAMGVRDATYTLGEIGIHNVAMTCLTSMGPVSSSKAVERMMRVFPRLRFIVLVGIAGAAPDPQGKDVRLGDVVVSMPGKGPKPREFDHVGVIQYDSGTKGQGESITVRPTDIGRASDTLLTAISDMNRSVGQQTDVVSVGQLLQNDMDALARQYPHMKGIQRPATDHLFRAGDEHLVDDFDCEEDCVKEYPELQERKARDLAGVPAVHYGLIASGSVVMRDATERDRLSRELGVLCFEMEAAGLSKDLPWLVVRGICDYCDTHKNKVWQDYAALAAATYVRRLLTHVGPLEAEPGSEEVEAKKPGREGRVQNHFNGKMNISGGQNSIGNVFSGNQPINFTYNGR